MPADLLDISCSRLIQTNASVHASGRSILAPSQGWQTRLKQGAALFEDDDQSESGQGRQGQIKLELTRPEYVPQQSTPALLSVHDHRRSSAPCSARVGFHLIGPVKHYSP